MENCIFCKIVNGKIPKEFIYKDENFLVFLDIKPVSDGHLIIIPKKHVVWMQDEDDDTIANIFILTKKLMRAIKNGLPCDYLQMSVVGTEVPHFHIHLIPRHHGDNFRNFPTKEYKDTRHESEILEKITRAL